MSKSAILMGDVTATPSTTDAANTWVLSGQLIPRLAQKISVNGQFVVLSDEQIFAGTNNSSGSPVPSTIKLEAGVTKLKDNGASILLNGDSNSDSFGNKVAASGSQKLFTA